MSAPPAMTKTTTSATTIRARVLLTRFLLLDVAMRFPSPLAGGRWPSFPSPLAGESRRSLEGGRPSPVEAGDDRVVDCHRVGRERPRPQLNDVCMAMDRAGSEPDPGERRPQSRAEPPQGERTHQRDRQLACRAEQQQG